MIKSKNTKGLKGSVDCIDSDELKTLKADKKSLERQLECYKSIAEEAIEVTPEHFDEGYGWSESIKKLKEKGGE